MSDYFFSLKWLLGEGWREYAVPNYSAMESYIKAIENEENQ